MTTPAKKGFELVMVHTKELHDMSGKHDLPPGYAVMYGTWVLYNGKPLGPLSRIGLKLDPKEGYVMLMEAPLFNNGIHSMSEEEWETFCKASNQTEG